MVNFKTVFIGASIIGAGYAAYRYLWPNTGILWLNQIGAGSVSEIKGYFNGIIRGIKVAGGSKEIFDNYLTSWKSYWLAQSPGSGGIIDYWANYANVTWSKIKV